MAEDLRCFLDERPIRARPPNALDRLFKWTRRRPAQAALSGVLLVVLLGAFVAITILWIDTAKARDRARAAAALVRRQSDVELRTRYRAGISAAASALELDHIDEVRSLLEDLPEEHRNWEWRYLEGQLDNSTIVFRPEDGPVKTFDLAPDGKSFAYSVDGSSGLRIRRGVAGRDFARFDGLASAITSAAFSPDGARVAAGSADGTVRVWRVEGGVPVATLEGQTSAVTRVVFDHTASRLLLLNDRSEANLWDLADGRRLALGRAWDCNHFSPDGRSIVCVSDGEMRSLSSVDGRPISLPDAGGDALEAAAFSPDGSRIATGGLFPATDIVIHPFTVAGKTIGLKGHGNSIASIDFSPDGRRLASGSLDETARIWDTATGLSLAVLRGHRDKLAGVWFTSDARRLLTHSADGAIRLWETSDGALLGSLRGHAGVSSIHLSRDGRSVAVSDVGGTVRIWDLDRTVRRGVLRGHTSFVYDVAITADGRWVASASWDEDEDVVRFWDQGTGGSRPAPGALAGSPRRSRHRRSALGSPRLSARASFAYGNRPASNPSGVPHSTPVRAVKATAGSRSIPGSASSPSPVTGNGPHDSMMPRPERPSEDCTATIERRATSPSAPAARRSPPPTSGARCGSGTPRRSRPGRSSRPMTAPSPASPSTPEGTMLASASRSTTVSVRVREAASGRPLATLKHAGPVYGLAFNPDGTRLATACRDNTIRLWGTTDFEEVAELRGHQAYVHAVAFGADGTRLVSGSGDFTVRIWEAPRSAALPRARSAAIRASGEPRGTTDIEKLSYYDFIGFFTNQAAILPARVQPERIP